MSVTIIADFGSNWDCEQDILDAIAPVKEAGADIFKLQYFNHKDLYGLSPVVQEKPKVDLEKIALACQDVDIELMCSVFNPVDVWFVDRYVMRHKIASAEATHPVLLEAVAATEKPVVISTGCINGHDDFKNIFKILDDKKTTVLYCVSEYPARNVDLRFIDTINIHNTECNVGFSDHSLDTFQTSKTAVAVYDVSMLEKHVYHRKVDGPDMPHSISIPELRRYCYECGLDFFKRYRLEIEINLPEFTNKCFFVRRPVAIQHIDPWQKLEYGRNWGFYRLKMDNNFPPVDNFDFMAIYRANSMISHHEIKAGQPIFLHNVRLVPRE